MSNVNTRAAEWYSARRSDGVPDLITADEAWRLTRGAVGKRGDHGTPVRLSEAALAFARRVY